MKGLIKIVFGGFAITFGLVMLAGFLASKEPFQATSDLALLFLLAFLPVSVGAGLILHQIRTNKQTALQKQRELVAAREKEILLLARSNNGRLTLAQIITDTNIDATQAEQAMNELALKGIVNLLPDTTGQLVYEFSGMQEQEPQISVRPDVLRES
jgi:hypothetical protein